MTIAVRTVSPDELEAFLTAFSIGLGIELSQDHADRVRRYVALDRLSAAIEGHRVVGTFGVHPLSVAVPGTTIPMAGVSMVTVLPTHRRRGILTQMMRQHLNDFRRRGEILAGLWASEGNIYGRFGFGMAVERVRWRIPRSFSVLREPIDVQGSMHLISHREAVEQLPPLYDTVWPHRPGMLRRQIPWWEHRVIADTHGASLGAQRRVLYAPDGIPQGYALYRTRRFDIERPLELQVTEVVARDGESERALWQFLFGVDLTETIDVWNLPADHSLRWWLSDIRKVERHVGDALWLRLVDVPACLASRHYVGPGRLSIRVDDSVCPWNSATFLLESDGAGRATCRTTDAAPDVTCDVEQLGSVYLGGVRWSNLAQAGLVRGSDNALSLADRLFGWPTTPWCPERF